MILWYYHSFYYTIIPYTCSTIILLCHHTVIPLYYHTIILSCYYTIMLTYHHTIIISCYHTMILSYSVILSYYHAIIPSLYHTIILSYHIILSYYHTIIPHHNILLARAAMHLTDKNTLDISCLAQRIANYPVGGSYRNWWTVQKPKTARNKGITRASDPPEPLRNLREKISLHEHNPYGTVALASGTIDLALTFVFSDWPKIVRMSFHTMHSMFFVCLPWPWSRSRLVSRSFGKSSCW